MIQRKVGQDMVVRKKPSQPVKVVLRDRVEKPAMRESERISRSVVQKTEPVIAKSYRHPVIEKREAVLPTRTKYSMRSDEPVYREPSKGGLLWVFVGAAVIALVLTIFSLLARSEIHLTLKQGTYIVDAPLTLYPEPTAEQAGLKTARVVDKQTILVSTTTKESSSAFASGTVKLFSSATKSISLPKGTQLISTANKTFVTKEKITIPSGTVKQPGSASVGIIATIAGPDSNIKLDDLKLPAFPSIIARTTTDISGGATGDQFVLSEAELTTAKTSLQTMMSRSHPAAFLANQIPANFVLPESLLQVSDITYRTESSSNGVVVIAERTITGNMIDREKLNSFLVNQIAPEPDRTFMHIIESNNISYELPVAVETPVNQETVPVIIHVTGSFTARADYNEQEILSKISTQKKSAALQKLNAIPGILSADIRLSPPWTRRIPERKSKVVFTVDYSSTE